MRIALGFFFAISASMMEVMKWQGKDGRKHVIQGFTSRLAAISMMLCIIFKEIDETTGKTRYKAKWVYSIESLDLAKKTLLQLQTASYDDGEHAVRGIRTMACESKG